MSDYTNYTIEFIINNIFQYSYVSSLTNNKNMLRNIYSLTQSITLNPALLDDPNIQTTIIYAIYNIAGSSFYPDYINDNPHSNLSLQEYIDNIYVNEDFYEYEWGFIATNALNKLTFIYIKIRDRVSIDDILKQLDEMFALLEQEQNDDECDDISECDSDCNDEFYDFMDNNEAHNKYMDEQLYILMDEVLTENNIACDEYNKFHNNIRDEIRRKLSNTPCDVPICYW